MKLFHPNPRRNNWNSDEQSRKSQKQKLRLVTVDRIDPMHQRLRLGQMGKLMT
jgi:hypothetical protein